MTGQALGIDEGLATFVEIGLAGISQVGQEILQFPCADERARVCRDGLRLRDRHCEQRLQLFFLFGGERGDGLTPEIAEQYDIVRSERRAFLNIAVLRNEDDGSTTPVTATLNGSKHNLLQQAEAIEFRQIREGEAIYYIGQFNFSDREVLRFTLEVHPEGQEGAHTIEWTTQLYAQ